jgi:16S rRNA (cytosine1402-N4)-methyltransferase
VPKSQPFIAIDFMACHVPVLLKEILSQLELRPGQLIIDATFGAGGYTQAFLASGARVIAFDRDPAAANEAKKIAHTHPGDFEFIHAPFSYMAEELEKRKIENIDAIVFDLGVSSMQLDRAERGFSFRFDGPLDMRMSSAGKSAADLVNALPEKELADLLYQYGEEKKSRSIAKAIAKERAKKPFTRTLELAELIEKTIGRHPRSKIHPATRSFQALRIVVNDELGELQHGLERAQKLLRPKGKLAIVTFHSLEDRIAKKFLAQERAVSRHAPAKKLTKSQWQSQKPIEPSEGEIMENPRARSAKLRIAIKI